MKVIEYIVNAISWIKTNHELINVFTNIAVAIGTIGAVIVALREKKPKAKVSANITFIITAGDRPKDKQKYVTLEAKNIGSMPIIINGFGWQVGVWKFKQCGVQMFSSSIHSTVLPAILYYGQTAHYMIPIEKFDIRLLASKSKLLNHLKSKFCYVLAYDSVGNTYYSRVAANLQEKILEQWVKVYNPDA